MVVGHGPASCRPRPDRNRPSGCRTSPSSRQTRPAVSILPAARRLLRGFPEHLAGRGAGRGRERPSNGCAVCRRRGAGASIHVWNRRVNVAPSRRRQAQSGSDTRSNARLRADTRGRCLRLACAWAWAAPRPGLRLGLGLRLHVAEAERWRAQHPCVGQGHRSAVLALCRDRETPCSRNRGVARTRGVRFGFRCCAGPVRFLSSRSMSSPPSVTCECPHQHFKGSA